MDEQKLSALNIKHITLTFEHNPYETHIFLPRKSNGKVVVFPIFNYQGYKQFIDLIVPIVDNGYRVITIKLLNYGDRVLFFNYYYTVFVNLLEDLHIKKLIAEKKKKEDVTILGFGVSANLASRMNFYHNDDININKIILISPVNKYKSEYKIYKTVSQYRIPTYIFYGQFDKVNDLYDRFQIFQNGKDNKNVEFYSYPASGYHLYYAPVVSMELDKIYRNSDFDFLIGESRRNRIPILPSDENYNEVFFSHLFHILSDTPNPKRVALLIDLYPLSVNGVVIVVDQLKEQLEKLGYEPYIVSLWKKDDDFALLPGNHHIPIIANYAKMVKNYKDLYLLRTNNVKDNAKELALFGFSYLHLHTEYTMSSVALELSRITGIKMPYTYHTLWRMYYQNNFGTLVGDMTFSASKSVFFNHIYKECPIITVPSLKSYDCLKAESNVKDVRIIPTPVNFDKFTTNKEDRDKINKLKTRYKLKGKKVLGYVGRVSTEKNITETIYNISRIINEIPNLVFMIVGVGDALTALQKYAKKLGVNDNIIYVGQIPYDDLKLYYPLFDVFVTASSFETQGLTYFEAAASGTLILAKKDRAIEGLLEDGANAYIYEDIYQWAEKLEKALFKDNRELIDNARATVKKFTLNKWVKQIEKIYKELNPENDK